MRKFPTNNPKGKKGKGVDFGNLESRALPEVIRKLGFLEVVSAVLALKPHHLVPTSAACSVCGAVALAGLRIWGVLSRVFQNI